MPSLHLTFASDRLALAPASARRAARAGWTVEDHAPGGLLLNPAQPLDLTRGLTVEAWVESEWYRPEALQALVSCWRPRDAFDAFAAHDASRTGGLTTQGFFGAVFDGRYVYFAPQHDGTERHGKVLRLDTHAEFHSPEAWSAWDASKTSGLNCRGYYGAAYDGRYIFFIPRVDNATHHTRLLRYDTRGAFDAPESWRARDLGLAMSCQSAAFDGRYLYLCPGYDAPRATLSGRFIRFDTLGAFDDPASCSVVEASCVHGLQTRCYDGAVYDGGYVYYAPLDSVGTMLRHDTRGGFAEWASWEAFDAREIGGLRMGKCVGAVFDGRHVYYVHYANSIAVRYDTARPFAERASWEAFDTRHTSGLDLRGYDGAAFDGRFVYFIPFWEGDDARTGFHGRVLRYDATRAFADPAAWQAVEAGATDGLRTMGYNAGASDGRFLYFAPWRQGTRDEGGFIAHGNVLRYDTTGADAAFSLRATDLGHNGGLCAALAGPAFLINTDRGARCVRAGRALGPGRHALAGVYDGRRLRLYVDGLCVAEREASGRIVMPALPVAVGRMQDGLGRFDGRIAAIRLTPSARTPDRTAADQRA